jgi:hypothetical protein
VFRTISEQHEAPRMNPAERHNLGSPVNLSDEWRGKLNPEVDGRHGAPFRLFVRADDS